VNHTYRFSNGGWYVQREDGARLGLRNRNGKKVLTWTTGDTKIVKGSAVQAQALALLLNKHEGDR
jgi:hypothetical protein